jgi:hypothetical protein
MKVCLVRTAQGYLPDSEHDREALGHVGDGEVIYCEVKRHRNVRFHRKAFALLKEMFEYQDQFTDPEQFRKWVKVQAGEYTDVFGSEGFYELKSWSFADMDEIEFEKTYNRIVTVAVEKMGMEWVLQAYA